MSIDLRDTSRFYMIQTTRLIQSHLEGEQYLGDAPIINGEQALVAGQSLLDSPEIRTNARVRENVQKRHARIVELFGQQAQSQVA